MRTRSSYRHPSSPPKPPLAAPTASITSATGAHASPSREETRPRKRPRMGRVLRIDDLPTTALSCVIAFLPPSSFRNAAAASRELCAAVEYYHNPTVQIVDLCPGVHLDDLAPSCGDQRGAAVYAPPVPLLFFLSVGSALRVLRLHMLVYKCARQATLATVLRHNLGLKHLAIVDDGVISHDLAAKITRVLTQITHLELHEPGQPILAAVHKLPVLRLLGLSGINPGLLSNLMQMIRAISLRLRARTNRMRLWLCVRVWCESVEKASREREYDLDCFRQFLDALSLYGATRFGRFAAFSLSVDGRNAKAFLRILFNSMEKKITKAWSLFYPAHYKDRTSTWRSRYALVPTSAAAPPPHDFRRDLIASLYDIASLTCSRFCGANNVQRLEVCVDRYYRDDGGIDTVPVLLTMLELSEDARSYLRAYFSTNKSLQELVVCCGGPPCKDDVLDILQAVPALVELLEMAMHVRMLTVSPAFVMLAADYDAVLEEAVRTWGKLHVVQLRHIGVFNQIHRVCDRTAFMIALPRFLQLVRTYCDQLRVIYLPRDFSDNSESPPSEDVRKALRAVEVVELERPDLDISTLRLQLKAWVLPRYSGTPP